MSEDRDQSALMCDGSEKRSQNNGRRISQAGKTRWHSDEQTQARGPKPDLRGRLCLDGKWETRYKIKEHAQAKKLTHRSADTKLKMVEELTCQMRSKRETFQLKS
jgi:hypothetical protein